MLRSVKNITAYHAIGQILLLVTAFHNSPTSQHVKMLRGGKILSVGGKIVANML